MSVGTELFGISEADGSVEPRPANSPCCGLQLRHTLRLQAGGMSAAIIALYLKSRPLAGLLFFELLFLSFRSLFLALFTFPEEFKMLLKERASGMYQLSAFFFARTFSGGHLLPCRASACSMACCSACIEHDATTSQTPCQHGVRPSIQHDLVDAVLCLPYPILPWAPV